jgi:uncharacterized membrane protein
MTPVSARARLWVAATAAAATLFCAGIVAVPIAERAGVDFAPWLRLAYRPLCHQISDRCLDLGAGPLAVCSRCAGLYGGGLFGLVVTLASGYRVRPGLGWLIASALPSVVDVCLGAASLPSLANWPRFLLALPTGLVLGLILADAVAEAAHNGEELPRRAAGRVD